MFVKNNSFENNIKTVYRVSKKDILRFSFGCNDYCGEWIAGRLKKSGQKKISLLRIVGGRRVINPRPWMALIEMTSNQGKLLVPLSLNWNDYII